MDAQLASRKHIQRNCDIHLKKEKGWSLSMQNEKEKDVTQISLKIRIFEILERQGLISEEEKHMLKILINGGYGK